MKKNLFHRKKKWLSNLSNRPYRFIKRVNECNIPEDFYGILALLFMICCSRLTRMIYEVLQRNITVSVYSGAKLVRDAAAALSFSSSEADKCMTGKYKVRKLLPRRDTTGSVTFYRIFLTTLERSLEAAHFSMWLKLSDVYRFSQWRFILASKVSAAGTAVCLPCSFDSLYRMLPKFARIFICLQNFLKSLLAHLFFDCTPSNIKTSRYLIRLALVCNV